MVLSGSVNPDGNSAQINAGIEKVQNQYSWSGGSCVQLDKLIKGPFRLAANLLRPETGAL